MGTFHWFACTLLAGVSATEDQANPIRKVVTLLQAMQKKVEAEGEKQKVLFDKFMCYCKNNGNDLAASIQAAETKGPQVSSNIEEAEHHMSQLKAAVEDARKGRAAALGAIADATSLRKKEKAEYDSESSDLKTNIEAISGAVAALERGSAGAFLQSVSAQHLLRLTNTVSMLPGDRQEIVAFLSGKASYAPQAGEITGILKTMSDEMSATLTAAVAAEKEAVANYKALTGAKGKEVVALTAEIQNKLERVSTLGVEIVQMKEDLSDTQAALLSDKQFLADLKKGCATKSAEWEEIKKTRSAELVALADTIKVLNDDDALELFKKTLPSASFIQVREGKTSLKKRALAMLHQTAKNMKGDRHRIDFIMLALRGKKIGFEKVIAMIDDMVALLGKEQVADEDKREGCLVQFDTSEDKKKALERANGQLEASIADGEEAIKTTAAEIAALKASIASLDKMVAAQTEQRKAEHSDYLELIASNTAAKDLLGFAKNRLNKFYNPKLYEPPPKKELTDAERATLAAGGTLAAAPPPGGIAGTGISLMQVSLHSADAPPPPPEIGAYSKQTGENSGVLAMLDLLIADLTKELTEAETEENLAKEDYAEAMADARDKRASEAKQHSAKELAKANLEATLAQNKDAKSNTVAELKATSKYVADLHAECDWLLKFFDVRKEARASEVASLKSAKAVLSGADFSLVQTHSGRFLSRQ